MKNLLSKIENYAKFIKQPKALEMFVPCDGNVYIIAQCMGMKKEEWLEIRQDGIVDNFNIKQELDEMFGTEEDQ